MVGIQNTTQKKFFFKSILFLCVCVLLFFLSTSFVYAGPSEWFHGIAIGIGGWFTYFGGMLFDKAIISLVLKMGDWINNQGLGGVINSIWTMIRDLFNILFIFSLVYIGLRTILDSDDSRTKKMLGMLIAAALLINFSLYIAKVVVDISNFTAVQVYETATKGIGGTYGIKIKDSDGAVVGGFETNQKSIAGAYMEVLSVSSWFDTKVGDGGSVSEGSNVFVYSVMAMLFLMFLGFILAYGALMLTVRFIAIIFYLMFSPFMFLGWILPQFQSFATKWWKGFIGYSFFAPVYIFMLYIGLYSLQQIKAGLGAGVSFGGAFADGSVKSVDTFSIFLLFAIGTGFLIGATKVASIMSQGGAAIGMGVADKFSKKFTTGLGARMGQSVGRGASGLAKYGAGYAGSAAVGWGSRKIGEKMDARSAASGKPRGRMGRALRSGVLSGETAKFGGSQSSKERGDADKTEARRHSQASRAYTTQQEIINATTDIDRETAVAKADAPTLIEMTKTAAGRKALHDSAGSLSDDKMKEIMKSDDVTPEIKESLSKARKNLVSTNLVEEHHTGGVAAGGTIEDVIHKADASELKTIGFDTAYENAALLTSKQIEEWKDLTPSQKRQLKKKRDADLFTLFTSHPDHLFNQIKSDTERSKLSKEILTHSNATQYLNKNILTKIVDNDGIEDGDRRSIRTKIENLHAAGTREGDSWRDWFDKNNAGQRYPS